MFRTRSSFLFPSLWSTACSSCGHRKPRGSRASRTSITTSDASITCKSRGKALVEDDPTSTYLSSDQHILPCLIQSKDAYSNSCQQLSAFQKAFYPLPVDIHPRRMKIRKQMHNKENRWRICGVFNLSSLFGTGLGFFTCSLFSFFSFQGSLFFFSFSVLQFFFLDLSKKQIQL